jgi:alpha-L-rhamnosidase
MRKVGVVLLLALGTGVGCRVVSAETAGPRAAELKCEFQAEPLGVDTAQPRLSWIGLQKERGAIQSGYEVQVSTNPQELAKGTQTVFDSGRVQSSSEMVVYAGEALSSNRDYYWRVRLWDGHGRAGAWSKIAHFEMGLQSPADWLDARWIAGRDETEWRARWRAQKAQEHTKYANSYMTPVTTSAHMNSWQLLDSVTPRYDPAPLLRKTFPVDRKIRKAHLYVSGVGYAVTSINGAALDGTTNRTVLDPGWTNYERRVLYRAFDVTNRLKIGRNALGITLGRGFYGMLSNDRWGFSEHAPWIDQPSLKSLLIIEYADGSRDTVASDDSWRTVPGPIVYDDPWLGEIYDAREEQPGWNLVDYDDAGWEHAHLTTGPAGRLAAQIMPPIREHEMVEPVTRKEISPGVWTLDMGINLAGWMRITVRGPRGARVLVQMAERPDANFIDITTNNYQQFGYILKGEGDETAESHFAYMGFRYVRISVSDASSPVQLEHAAGVMVHTDAKSVGTFNSSNALLNQIDSIWLRTQLNNMYSIPTDCPHREKLGWMADAYVLEPAVLFNFDTASFYENYAQDVSQTQDESGAISVVAPSFGYVGGLSPTWASAEVLIPWRLYEFHGDRRILETQFETIKRFLDSTLKMNGTPGNQYLIQDVLGDWASPGYTNPPEGNEPYGTASYYLDLGIAAQMATVLGDAPEAARLTARAVLVRDAFNQAFYDRHNHIYKGLQNTEYRQSINAVALWLHLVPDSERAEVFANLCRDVEARGFHLNTGVIGTKPMLEVLTDNGRVDLAYRVINQTTFPGWGYMLAKGATTMWESWTGDDSFDHPMEGSVVEYFYRYLAGIRTEDEHPGFEEFQIAPIFPEGLNSVSSTYESSRGKIVSNWERRSNELALQIEVPFNSRATIKIPLQVAEGCTVVEGRTAVWPKSASNEDPGVENVDSADGSVGIMVGSGNYEFKERCH